MRRIGSVRTDSLTGDAAYAITRLLNRGYLYAVEDRLFITIREESECPQPSLTLEIGTELTASRLRPGFGIGIGFGRGFEVTERLV